MKLHENKALFRQAVQFTADQMNIPALYVEKDYWVTYALSTIFHNEIGTDTIFKGGTALSKCYKMIDRFSEDIDLVVVRRHGESENKLKSKLKIVSNTVSTVLPEVEIVEITNKKGMIRKTQVGCFIYTKRINKRLQLDVDKHNAKYPPIELRELTESHDRFLIIDRKELYHIGASLKDLGKKWFAFSRMDSLCDEVLNKLKGGKNE